MSTINKIVDMLLTHKKTIIKHSMLAIMAAFLLFGVFYCVYPDVTVHFRELRKLIYIAFIVEFSSLMFKQRVRYIASVYVLSAVLFLILLVYKLVYNSGINVESLKTYSFFIAVSSLITMLTTLGNEKIIPKIIGNILLVILAMSVVAVFLGYYAINGTWFGTDAILAILQTNSNEALEYASSNGNFNLLFSMLFLLALAIGWKCINRKIECVKYNNYIYIYIYNFNDSNIVCLQQKQREHNYQYVGEFSETLSQLPGF